MTVPIATRSATGFPTVSIAALSFNSDAGYQLTGHGIVHKRGPKRKTVIESTARVLPPLRLESDAGVDPARPSLNVRRDKVVERDAHPLRRRRAPAVDRRRPDLGHVVVAGCDCRGEVGGVGAPVVDEDVLEECGLGRRIVERGERMVGHEGGRDEDCQSAHRVNIVVSLFGECLSGPTWSCSRGQ